MWVGRQGGQVWRNKCREGDNEEGRRRDGNIQEREKGLNRRRGEGNRKDRYERKGRKM